MRIIKYLPSFMLVALFGVDATFLFQNHELLPDLHASDITDQKGKNSSKNGNGSGKSSDSSSGVPSGSRYIKVIQLAKKYVTRDKNNNVSFHDNAVNSDGYWKDCYRYDCIVDSGGCYLACCPEPNWEIVTDWEQTKSGVDNGCNHSGCSYKK